MKAKKTKKNMKEYISDNAVYIKCKHCELKDTCIRKKRKSKDERKGVRTFCLLTTNEPKKTLKKMSRKNSKNRVV